MPVVIPVRGQMKADTTERLPRLVFLINSMEGGGAERALANLLRFLRGRLAQYQTEIVLLDNLPVQQELPEEIPVFVLNGGRGMLSSATQLIRHFRRRPADICISYLARSNCLNVFTAPIFGHRAIISERVQTTEHQASARFGFFYRRLISMLYPRAEVSIAVSEGVAEDLARNYGVRRDRLRVIGNPMDAQAIRKSAAESPSVQLPDHYAIALGRLVVNKHCQMLIRAYARRPRPYDLVILGEGPLREDLTQLCRSLGVEARVHMLGFVQNPYPCIRAAKFFVSASNAEGFPNAMIEAMILEKPVIATDCQSGPNEILVGDDAQVGRDPLRSARFGMLVPVGDVDALSAALDTIEDTEIADDYAARAATRSKAFQVDQVVRGYLDIINGNCGHRE